MDTLIHELNNRFPKESLTLADAYTNLYYCNYKLIILLLEIYNLIFYKNSIDNQLLKAQMDIAKLELHEDFSYNNVKSVIAFPKYPLFYKYE